MGKVIHAEARFAARRIAADQKRKAPSGDGLSGQPTPKQDARAKRLRAMIEREKR
jgi:hypothetical protein